MYYPINHDEMAFLNEIKKGSIDGNLILVDPELIDDLNYEYGDQNLSEDFIVSCLDEQSKPKVTKQFTVQLISSEDFEWIKQAVDKNLNKRESIIVRIYSNTLKDQLSENKYSVQDFIELDDNFLDSLSDVDLRSLYSLASQSLEEESFSEIHKSLLNYFYRKDRRVHEFVAGYSLAIDNLGLQLYASFFDLNSKQSIKKFLDQKQNT